MDTPMESKLSWQQVDWDIRREGRAWSAEEIETRYFQLTPGKIELIEGKLFWNEEERMRMLGLLLENVGVDQAVRLGDPEVWHRAFANRDRPEARPGGPGRTSE